MLLDTMPRSKAEATPDRSATLCGRVTSKTVEALDAIARSKRPVPTRSQLVALAIEEFIEREQAQTQAKQK